MRRRTVFTGIMGIMLCSLTAAQGSFTWNRKWVVGDKEAFRVYMDMCTQAGDVLISYRLDQTVAQKYDNGDADLETLLSELKILFNGQEMHGNVSASANKRTMQRVNKFGVPVGKLEALTGRGGLGFNYAWCAALIVDRSMKIGETISIKYTDPDEPKRTVNGSVTLENLTEGIAELVAKYDVTTEDAPEPIKCVMTALVRVADCKVMRSEGTFSNIHGPQGIKVDAIQFRMERIDKPNGS